MTGAFGNVGTSAVAALLKRGHQVRCLDLHTRVNRRTVRRFGGEIEVVWGDPRRPQDPAAAIRDQDVVVHLAFIIPNMSTTGVESEKRPDWARDINVGGTRNLLHAMESLATPPKILLASSYHVFGQTQHQPPPRTIADPVQPTEHHPRHKVVCERMLKRSGLEWSIFRLAATLPLALRLDPGMFDVPLDNRMEFVHTRDVGEAVAKGVSNGKIWGRTLLIGGRVSVADIPSDLYHLLDRHPGPARSQRNDIAHVDPRHPAPSVYHHAERAQRTSGNGRTATRPAGRS